MRFAYADPPYLGCGAKHYGHQHTEASVYDGINAHGELIAQLVAEYPDGWALSTSSVALGLILPFCPAKIRIGAWVKPFASFKPNVNPAFAWEPVIFCGGRSAKERGGRTAATTRDWVSANITLEKGTAGAKPEAFCLWVFSFLGAQPTDALDDLFPGSGAVTRAWENWKWHNTPGVP